MTILNSQFSNLTRLHAYTRNFDSTPTKKSGSPPTRHLSIVNCPSGGRGGRPMTAPTAGAYLSILNSQFSALNCQLSPVNCQLSIRLGRRRRRPLQSRPLLPIACCLLPQFCILHSAFCIHSMWHSRHLRPLKRFCFLSLFTMYSTTPASPTTISSSRARVMAV